MDLDFRKLNSIKLFDFSKEEENLITEVYLNIEDSICNQLPQIAKIHFYYLH